MKRSIKNRSVVSLLLVAVLVFFAACASTPATTGNVPAGGGGGGGGGTSDAAEATGGGGGGAEGPLTIYTSMKESKMGDIIRAFNEAYPDIRVEHYSAGAGRLMARIAAEREAGDIQADMLWTSEVPDFYSLADAGVLHEFIPSARAAGEIFNPLVVESNYFTPARLAALGIIYNTNHIQTPPTDWEDLMDPSWYGGFAIANPSVSGTALVSVAMLGETFGSDFFERLRANGAMVGGGSGQVVDDTAIGEYYGALAVDYIVFDVMDLGATVGMAWPTEMIVIPSPVAIFRDSNNGEAAELFLEFLLGEVGQQIVADNGTTPVRPGMYISERFNLPPVEEMMERAMTIDFVEMAGTRESIIDDFLEIMQF
jgi:iron(III) transport system substrate-binding protein